MRNSAAFLDYQLRTALLQGNWMIDRAWAENHLPLVVQLIEGKAQWPQEMQTRNQGIRSYWEDDDDSEASGEPKSRVETVRVIDIRGALTKMGGMCSYGTIDYTKMIQNAYADDGIEAIVIRMDSPGGEVSGIMEMHDAVKNDAKPVVVWVEDIAASGGYISMSGADYIMASQASSMIGSIGVMLSWMDMSEYMKARGITAHSLYSTHSSEKNQESRELRMGNEKPMQAVLDELATMVIESVRSDRGEKLDAKAGDPFKGKTYFAKEAQALGLIDAIGPFEAAVQKALDLVQERKATAISKYSINSQINKNEMFDKHPKLTALRGVAADAVTDEQVEAVNAALAEQGIAGVQVVKPQWVTQAQAKETQLEAANSTIAKLTGERDGLNSKLTAATGEATTLKGQVTQLTADVATLTAERDTATAEVARLGKQPGATPAAPVKAGQEANEDVSGEDANPFFSEADAQLAEMKKGAGL